jgi:branched-chain amino acid transport system ATP-binding protein
MSAFLELQNCTVEFGGLKAVDSLDLVLCEGEMVGLIGPNGAGKTTVFNVITGVYQPSRGEIRFDGRRVDGLSTHQINRLGIARTFQNIRLFRNLNVLDNVVVAFNQRAQRDILGTLTLSRRHQDHQAEILRKSHELLAWVGLDKMCERGSSDLPYGQQRRLEIVRALATHPRLLLLDEPAAGMNHTEKKELSELIGKLRREFRLTLLVIEHDMKVIMNMCPRIVVLDHGQKIAEGPPEEIQRNADVIEAYLGEKSAAVI